MYKRQVQGDPFAAPSKVSIHVRGKRAGFPEHLYQKDCRRIAVQDCLLRQFARQVEKVSFKAKDVYKRQEYTITSILQQGGKIDSFGVGERLITAKSDPVFGAVYKISAVEENGTFAPRIKISENVEKITNPGLKDVYRIYDEAGHSVADLITKAGETVDMSAPYLSLIHI